MGEYKSRLENKDMDFLIECIQSLKTKEEYYRFFEDVCTVYEIKAIQQRLQVARMLMERRTYLDIASTTGASTATISRVNRSLNYGNQGYKVVFDRVNWKNR
ncbi:MULTISPECIES: YerC/YecD family TrpR-related protein [Clostridium]|uniref:TrpR-like protein YerC/YecD n=1 Tax=Clostridium senegalense TaxID=1465809 RepID=A0A6M0H2F4_9CLOT|nr:MULTISPECIES: YerC/YecD family TrpR-related protein [Clostridium]MBU5226163.1 TrpR-like protein YerC/YecD [Clostridium senegalense]NEU03812.1 TrpR-like protein YerC/YecD [Clostridium senegalense]